MKLDWLAKLISRQRGDDWLLDIPWLFENVVSWRKSYKAAEPFPHIVLDNFLDPKTVKILNRYFSGVHYGQRWREMPAYTDDGAIATSGKMDSADVLLMQPIVRQLIWEMNSKPFLQFLQKLSGIPRLISDPLCFGGGLHEIKRGGLLKVHVDFQKHAIYQLDRRLNLILYLNENWKEEYGGHLELWNQDLSICGQKILPISGRCVIFTTSQHSYHGHPQPLKCPSSRSRRSIALYYYTNGKDDSERKISAPTYWKETPES